MGDIANTAASTTLNKHPNFAELRRDQQEDVVAFELGLTGKWGPMIQLFIELIIGLILILARSKATGSPAKEGQCRAS